MKKSWNKEDDISCKNKLELSDSLLNEVNNFILFEKSKEEAIAGSIAAWPKN